MNAPGDECDPLHHSWVKRVDGYGVEYLRCVRCGAVAVIEE